MRFAEQIRRITNKAQSSEVSKHPLVCKNYISLCSVLELEMGDGKIILLDFL